MKTRGVTYLRIETRACSALIREVVIRMVTTGTPGLYLKHIMSPLFSKSPMADSDSARTCRHQECGVS